MDPRIAIWNILHDGEITAAARAGSRLELFVSIPYLRTRFAPPGDSFSLRLAGVTGIEFADYEGKQRTSDVSEIVQRGLEILQTDSTAMPVKIDTTAGTLTLGYEALEIRLDTGEPLDFAAIDDACAQYWEEWSAKATAIPPST